MVVLVVVVGTMVVCWLVNLVFEMEVRLPSTAVILDIISEGGALDKWVVLLTVGKVRVRDFEVAKDINGLLERVWGLGNKSVLGNVGH